VHIISLLSLIQVLAPSVMTAANNNYFLLNIITIINYMWLDLKITFHVLSKFVNGETTKILKLHKVNISVTCPIMCKYTNQQNTGESKGTFSCAGVEVHKLEGLH